MAENKVKIFLNLFSQPSRAVLQFALIANIPHEVIMIDMGKGEHKSAEYLEQNPFGVVPSINDNGFKLAESHAILKYLARQYKAQDNWYPADPKKCAKVDIYLDWHHTGMRKNAAGWVFNKVFAPMMKKPQAPGWEQLEEKTKKESLKSLNDIFLKDTPYIAGNEPSIADLACVNEIFSLVRLVGLDLSEWPKVQTWFGKLSEMPQIKGVFDQVDQILAQMAQQQQ